MTTTHRNPTPIHDPQDWPVETWPVLLRIPDATTVARPVAQRSPSPPTGSPAYPTDYRFDPPQSRGPQGLIALAAASEQSISEDHSAPSWQLPAHHLHQRNTRSAAKQSDRATPPESPILPDWNPFAISASSFPDTFAPILSFLVLVALFTAAGTSVLMLRNTERSPVSGSSLPASKVQRSVAGPTAAGPHGFSEQRLEIDESAVSSAKMGAMAPSAPWTPLEGEMQSDDVAGDDEAPRSASTPNEQVYPTTSFPAPASLESSEQKLPQAQMNDPPSAPARLSGTIYESPTRQAQHDDQSSVH